MMTTDHENIRDAQQPHAQQELEDIYQQYDQEQNYMDFTVLKAEIKTIWQFIIQNNSQIETLIKNEQLQGRQS